MQISRATVVTARTAAPMRWQLAALTAVWLVILSWCGSAAHPIDARLDKTEPTSQQRDARTASNDGDDLWNLIDATTVNESTGDEDFRPASEHIYYVPMKRLPANMDDEPGTLNWPVNPPGRSKRQSHFGSVGGHHFGGQMPQLSISSPIEALRNRLRLEMSRRLDNQIKQNQKLLESVGKRRKRRHALLPGTEKTQNKPVAVIKAP